MAMHSEAVFCFLTSCGLCYFRSSCSSRQRQPICPGFQFLHTFSIRTLLIRSVVFCVQHCSLSSIAKFCPLLRHESKKARPLNPLLLRYRGFWLNSSFLLNSDRSFLFDCAETILK